LNFINVANISFLVIKATVCSLCNRALELAGTHTPVSIKCGHVFGKSCLLQEIMTNDHVCPNCGEEARPSDIRPIHTPNIVKTDGSVENAIRAELDASDKIMEDIQKEIIELKKQSQWKDIWNLSKAVVAGSLILNVFQLVRFFRRRF